MKFQQFAEEVGELVLEVQEVKSRFERLKLNIKLAGVMIEKGEQGFEGYITEAKRWIDKWESEG